LKLNQSTKDYLTNASIGLLRSLNFGL